MANIEDQVMDGCLSWDNIPVARDSREVPPEGAWPGVIAGLCYAGVQASQFKVEGRQTLFVGFVFTDAAGKRHSAWQRYTLSVDQRGNFYPLVVAALGKAFPRRREDGGFDPRLLYCKRVLVEIEHVEKGGRRYADVASVSRLPAGMVVPEVEQPLEVPQWIIDVAAKRLDPPPQSPQPVPTTKPPAPTSAPQAAKLEGDGVEEWAKIGYCKADDGDEGGDLDGAVVADVTEG